MCEVQYVDVRVYGDDVRVRGADVNMHSAYVRGCREV